MHTIKVQLDDMSAAHRLIKEYHGKCRTLHGHNYAIFLTFSSPKLDNTGFVIDFNVVKKQCNQWLLDNWDHAILICGEDHSLIEFARNNKQKHYIFGDDENTTAEVVSKKLYEKLNRDVMPGLQEPDRPITLDQVEIWETSTSCAQYHE